MSGKGQVGSKRKLLAQWLSLASALYPKVLWHSLKVDEGWGQFLPLVAILHGKFLGGMDSGWPASRLGLRGRLVGGFLTLPGSQACGDFLIL